MNLFFLVWGCICAQFARNPRSWDFWANTVGMALWLSLCGTGMVLTAIGVVILVGAVA